MSDGETMAMFEDRQEAPAIPAPKLRKGAKLHLVPASLGREDFISTTLCGRGYEKVMVALQPEDSTCLRCRRSVGLPLEKGRWETLMERVVRWFR